MLEEIDKRAAGSPTVVAHAVSPPPDNDDSPTPYAGKFDPKAIAKRVTTASTGPTTLGKDILLPEPSKASATSAPSGTGLKADNVTAGSSAATSK